MNGYISSFLFWAYIPISLSIFRFEEKLVRGFDAYQPSRYRGERGSWTPEGVNNHHDTYALRYCYTRAKKAEE